MSELREGYDDEKRFVWVKPSVLSPEAEAAIKKHWDAMEAANKAEWRSLLLPDELLVTTESMR